MKHANKAKEIIFSFLTNRLFYLGNYANYGNCYTFNSKLYKNQGSSYITSLTAPNFGLYLVLNLDQRNYMRQGLTKQVIILIRWTCIILKFRSNFNSNSHLKFLFSIGRSKDCYSQLNDQCPC